MGHDDDDDPNTQYNFMFSYDSVRKQEKIDKVKMIVSFILVKN